jgi:hypothetical protein
VEELLVFLLVLPLALWRQMRAHRVSIKRLAVLPAVFLVLGIAGSATRAMPTDAEAIAYLVLSAALGIGFGVWRGLVIPVWRDGDGWWEQGNAKTLALWAAMLALKGALALAAELADVYPGDHSGEIYIFIALSFAAQEGLVARRTIWSRSR